MANNQYDRSKPKYEWGDGWRKGAITEKQAQYIATLIDKLAVAGLNVQMVKPLNTLTKGGASCLIDELKQATPTYTRYLIRNCSTMVTVEKTDE